MCMCDGNQGYYSATTVISTKAIVPLRGKSADPLEDTMSNRLQSFRLQSIRQQSIRLPVKSSTISILSQLVHLANSSTTNFSYLELRF